MNIELLIHGVPNGHDYYGPKEDLQYASTFYSLSSPFRERFQIEVRKVGDIIFSYFHFLLSGNIVAADSRKGGYFGISLRMDCFVHTPLTVCNILETVCKTKVIGSILVPIEQNLKYSAQTFDQHKTTIASIEDELGRLLTYILTPNNTIAINPQLIGSKQGVIIRNSRDCSNADVFKCLASCGKIIISTSAQTINESEYVNNLNASNIHIEELQGEIIRLRREVENSKNEVLELCNKLSKYARSNQSPIPANSQFQPTHHTVHRNHAYGKSNTAIKVVVIIMACIALLTVLLYFWGILDKL